MTKVNARHRKLQWNVPVNPETNQAKWSLPINPIKHISSAKWTQSELPIWWKRIRGLTKQIQLKGSPTMLERLLIWWVMVKKPELM